MNCPGWLWTRAITWRFSRWPLRVRRRPATLTPKNPGPFARVTARLVSCPASTGTIMVPASDSRDPGACHMLRGDDEVIAAQEQTWFAVGSFRLPDRLEKRHREARRCRPGRAIRNAADGRWRRSGGAAGSSCRRDAQEESWDVPSTASLSLAITVSATHESCARRCLRQQHDEEVRAVWISAEMSSDQSSAWRNLDVDEDVVALTVQSARRETTPATGPRHGVPFVRDEDAGVPRRRGFAGCFAGDHEDSPTSRSC